jgi:hypothetical protein
MRQILIGNLHGFSMTIRNHIKNININIDLKSTRDCFLRV